MTELVHLLVDALVTGAALQRPPTTFPHRVETPSLLHKTD